MRLLSVETRSFRGARALLDAHLAVVVRGALAPERCARWCAGVLAARDAWIEDFDGDQHALGRAFYTHLETGRTELYFSDASASDARVERHAPGLQGAMAALLAEAVEHLVDVRRRGPWLVFIEQGIVRVLAKADGFRFAALQSDNLLQPG